MKYLVKSLYIVGTLCVSFLLPRFVFAYDWVSQPDVSTSTVFVSGVAQRLGFLANYMSGFQGVTVAVKNDSGSCSGTWARLRAWSDNYVTQVYASDYLVSSDIVGTSLSYVNFATSSIPLNLSYRYTIEFVPCSASSVIYGSLTDLYAGGDCGKGFPPTTACSPVVDLMFTVYGFKLSTGVVSPIPSWNVSVPVLSSPPSVDVGGVYNINDDDDGIHHYVDILVSDSKYFTGVFPEFILDLGSSSGVYTVSTSTSQLIHLGKYYMRQRVYHYWLGLWPVTDMSTTTSFWLGPVNSNIPSSGLTKTIEETVDELESISCSVSWSSLSSIFSCFLEYAQVGFHVVYDSISDLIGSLLSKWPFGYLYHIYDVLAHPVSGTLPGLDITFNGEYLGGENLHVNLSPWDAIASSSDMMYTDNTGAEMFWTSGTASSSYHKSIGTIFDGILNGILGVMFAVYVVGRLTHKIIL